MNKNLFLGSPEQVYDFASVLRHIFKNWMQRHGDIQFIDDSKI